MMKYVKGVSLLLLLGFMLASNMVYAVTQRTDSLDCSTFTGDVTNTAEGWSWNHSTKTLTLNGVDFTSDITTNGDSTIIVNGSNKISARIYHSSEKKTLIIKGEGTIDFTNSQEDYTISSENGLVNIKGVTLKSVKRIHGGYSQNYIAITIEGAIIDFDSWICNIFVEKGGDIVIADSTLKFMSEFMNVKEGGIGTNQGNIAITNSNIKFEGEDSFILTGYPGSLTILNSDISFDATGRCVLESIGNVAITNSKVSINSKEYNQAGIYSINDISITNSDISITGKHNYGISGNKINLVNSKIDAVGSLAAIYVKGTNSTINLQNSLPVIQGGTVKSGTLKEFTPPSTVNDTVCKSFTTNETLTINEQTEETTASTHVIIDGEGSTESGTKTAHTLTAVAGASHTLTIEGVKYGDNIEVWNNATDRGKGSLIAKATAKNPTPNAGDTSYVNINIKGDKLPTDRKVWYTVSNKAIKSKANITPAREEKERDTGTAVTFNAPYTLNDVTATIINNWQNKSDIVLIQNVNPGTTVTLYYYASAPSDSKIKPKDKIKSVTVKAGRNYASFDGIDTNKGTVWVTINQEKKNASGESGRKMLPVVEAETE